MSKSLHILFPQLTRVLYVDPEYPAESRGNNLSVDSPIPVEFVQGDAIGFSPSSASNGGKPTVAILACPGAFGCLRGSPNFTGKIISELKKGGVLINSYHWGSGRVAIHIGIEEYGLHRQSFSSFKNHPLEIFEKRREVSLKRLLELQDLDQTIDTFVTTFRNGRYQPGWNFVGEWAGPLERELKSLSNRNRFDSDLSQTGVNERGDLLQFFKKILAVLGKPENASFGRNVVDQLYRECAETKIEGSPSAWGPSELQILQDWVRTQVRTHTYLTYSEVPLDLRNVFPLKLPSIRISTIEDLFSRGNQILQGTQVTTDYFGWLNEYYLIDTARAQGQVTDEQRKQFRDFALRVYDFILRKVEASR